MDDSLAKLMFKSPEERKAASLRGWSSRDYIRTMNESLTPMMQQYRELKARDPDALLLFRMGDFYEMFGDDAERASALLGLALTSRDKGDDAVPMAGFPHPALETYLAKIVQAGLRAAVCEQVEDARLAKGLVKRDVVRIVSPGTLTDDELLDPKTANYLAAIVEAGAKLGLAWVELSTGRFSLTGCCDRARRTRLPGSNPAEILLSELSLDAPWARLLRGQSVALTARPSWDFQPEQARKTLFEHFRTTTLAGFGIDDRAIEVQAAGALMAYLQDTQKSSLGHIARLIPYRRADTLALDEMTRRSLELVRTLREGKREGSLLSVIDLSATPMGSRQLAEWLTSPLTSTELIDERLEAVERAGRERGASGRSAEPAGPVVRPRALGRAGRHRAGHPARPGGAGQDSGDPAQAQGAADGADVGSGSTSSRRRSSFARRSAPRSKRRCTTTRRWP